MKISSAMKPDSYESFSPSHFGRTTNRRNASPAIETATNNRKHGDEVEIEAPERALPRQERESEAAREMVQRDQRERAKAPEYERVRESGQRPLPDDLALQHHLPEEVARCAGRWAGFCSRVPVSLS